MTVVSDSSPLITLARIGLLDLFPRLYETVKITTQVYNEIVVTGDALAGSAEIAVASWIETKPVSLPANTGTMKAALGAGEVSTILLATELAADLVFIDEIKARKAAIAEGLSVLGCVGILEQAFEKGLVPDLTRVYHELLQAGAYIDRRILAHQPEYARSASTLTPATREQNQTPGWR